MSSNSSNSSTKSCDLGNTKPSRPKQISPAKRWCFTFHFEEESEYSSILPTNCMNYDIIRILERECDALIVGKEFGEFKDTHHLQGYCEFKKKLRPLSLELDPTIHWEKSKGNKTQNGDYCRKEGLVIIEKGFPKPIKLIDPTYEWEKEIICEIANEPNDRTIFWYWGVGNLGKTSFCKYLSVKHGAIALGGKGADMRNGVVEYKKTNGHTPELVLINIPRSFDVDYVSYEGIENIKDMYFYSGKYEGGMVCGNSPHLFIFANEPPNVNKLSNDRWVIREIQSQALLNDYAKIEKVVE